MTLRARQFYCTFLIDTNISYFVFSGLFHKAISESGTALVPWAEAPPGEPKLNAFRLAKFLNCPQAPSERMIKCLRSLDSYDIIDTEFKFYVRVKYFMYFFHPFKQCCCL